MADTTRPAPARPAPARQLVLDLPLSARFGAEDFLVGGSNEAAYALLEVWPDWPDPLLWLQGPAGSGKSHLAAIWAERAGAPRLPAATLTADIAAAFAAAPALALEDVDRGPADESTLFHLLNRFREDGRSVLVTSRAGPDGSGIRTPDLLSRLRRAPAVTLGPPDDALLRAVLVKLFLDRQIVVDTTVVEFLATRIERSVAAAAAIVGDLDRETLSLGRRVTRVAAVAMLARHGDRDETE